MILTHPQGDPAAAVWIDLLQPTDEEIARVRAVTGLRVPSESQVSEIESTSRLAFDAGAFYMSAPLVTRPDDGGGLRATPVGFVLSSHVLLTVRFAPVASFEVAHDEAAARPPKDSGDAILRLFEIIVDRAADAFERSGGACDDLAHAVFRERHGRTKRTGNLGAALRRIGDAAEAVSHIRDELLGLGRLVGYLTEGGAEGGAEGAPTVNEARVKAIRSDVTSLTDYESHLSNKVQFLLDATLGFINIEQNEIVKTLTVASVVGIPPVLIAGIYGMNFRIMPELHWTLGYPFAIALILVSGLLPLAWFKWRGWM